jgi:hypothetical protein
VTYEQLLQQQPLSTSAGDCVLAGRFVDQLTAYIKGHGVGTLSEAQKNYLYKLRAKWQLRAQGKDTSWNTYGSTPGRRKSLLRADSKKGRVDPTTYGTEDELDPLLADVIHRFGTPKRTDDI